MKEGGSSEKKRTGDQCWDTLVSYQTVKWKIEDKKRNLKSRTRVS